MADAKENPYNTRKTKATTQDSDDEDQPLTQMEEQTKEKKRQTWYQREEAR